MNNSNFQTTKRSGASLISELEEKITLYSRVPHYVLITGERGTGKTTIARRLHELSPRAKKEFINLNCASLTEGLLESELFGYEKGAFTGATAPKAGLFEIANGGTLFLDEIGEIPPVLQAKLLKAIEEKRIRRVGSNVERPVDTRIIAATSQDLDKMAADGRFRADLFDRLNILKLETVPLRFQKEKIKDILRESLKSQCQLIGRSSPLGLSVEVLQLLESYDWLGNFRELHNFAARAAVECLDEKTISSTMVRRILNNELQRDSEAAADDDFPSSAEKIITVTFDLTTDDLEQIYLKAAAIAIRHLLSETDGSLRQAGVILGAKHSTLSRILAKFDKNCEIKRLPLNRRAPKQFATAA